MPTMCPDLLDDGTWSTIFSGCLKIKVPSQVGTQIANRYLSSGGLLLSTELNGNHQRTHTCRFMVSVVFFWGTSR